MISSASDSSSKLKKLEVEQGKEWLAGLPNALSRLKKQVQASRAASVKEKIASNVRKLEASTSQVAALARTKGNPCDLDQMDNKNMLTLRTTNVLCKLNGSISGFGERDNINSQEELPSSEIVFGNNGSGKCPILPVKLPFVEKMPPYTTWIFLARNQLMADDQSVVGRRQIYYDQHCGETLICSDSEGEVAEMEEEKHEFSEAEDQIIWNVLQQYGSAPEVFSSLSQFIDATEPEILERCETLLKKSPDDPVKCSGASEDIESKRTLSLEKTLDAALDSFDNLFCRRCFTFDCRLHGCSQSLILPSEKQQPSCVESEGLGKPCGDQCYLLRSAIQDSCEVVSTSGASRQTEIVTAIDKVVTSDTENLDLQEGNMQLETLGRKHTIDDRGSSLVTAHKKQKMPSPSVLSADDEDEMDVNPVPVTSVKHPDPMSHCNFQNQDKPEGEPSGNYSEMDIVPCSIKLNQSKRISAEDEEVRLVKATVFDLPDSHIWNPFEKDLFLKGLEIFGKNSCLIARNLLSGLKTCEEVFKYMFNDEASFLKGPMMTNSSSENNVTDPEYMEEMQTRTRTWRRRGRTRRLKYTWKSAGYPSIRKRIADGKEQCKKYVPCGCQQMCGKECPCHNNGTCCEKYCGCSKSCKNRFRGCHCAKSQCRSRQCPCYASGRECDPDVCRNCWVSCGDGSLGEPPARGDSHQCGNMKLLLKQQQRILLGRSDVAGWGAFIKSPVNKHDYLGEYTGELISHKEADKRGKIYDRTNSSFLFDLNDQYVLDAYRKGDKLKFANHSLNPNCYAKVMLVAGDHRVGIFAKERIEAGEELFYDYRYGPDQAPAWARKPEGSKKDDLSSSHSKRAHKVA